MVFFALYLSCFVLIYLESGVTSQCQGGLFRQPAKNIIHVYIKMKIINEMKKIKFETYKTSHLMECILIVSIT